MSFFSKLMRSLGLLDASDGANAAEQSSDNRSPTSSGSQQRPSPQLQAPPLSLSSAKPPTVAPVPELASPTPSPTSSSHVVTHGHGEPTATNVGSRDDVIVGTDGRFRAAGYSFGTWAQAADFADRQSRRSTISREDVDNRQPRQLAEGPVRKTPSLTVPATELDHGVTKSADGRYRAGGYVFETEPQARSYALRRTSGVPGLQSARRVEEARPTYQLPPPPPAPPSTPPPPPQRTKPSPTLWAPPHQPSVRRVRPAVKPQREPRWIVGPELLEIGPISFDAKLVYVGHQADPYGYPRHPALIDPALTVAERYVSSDTVNSWNADYHAFDPAARRGYLEWLAAGRPGGAAPAFAKLYFYGLERRLLLDDAKAEAHLILAELRRLMVSYGEDYNFGPAAAKLIDLASLIAKEDGPRTRPNLLLGNGYELPLKLRIELGEQVAAGEPLGSDAALCWLLATPQTYPRTAITRCFDEFLDLWGRRFAEIYPAGLKVRVPKARINYRYQSSNGFHADMILPDVPDLSGTSAPLGRLRNLMDECSDALGSYSRLVGGNASVRGTLPAAALLPPVMSKGPFGEPLRAARRGLALTPDKPTITTTAAILDATMLPDPGDGGTVNTACQKQLAQRLDAIGVGFEPDRRYGATGPMSVGSIIGLFELGDTSPLATDDPTYATARSVVDIAILAASSDGAIVPAEILAIGDHIAGFSELHEGAHRRLAAHIAVATEQPPRLAAALKRLADLPNDARRNVATAAAATILADGQILPAEVRFLENLYKVLGLPQDDVYGLLHRGGGGDAPVTVMAARPEAGIPLPREMPKSELLIDSVRLARIRSETTDVSKLLASIFVEDAAPPVEKVVGAEIGRYGGLDKAHEALLALIVENPETTRSDFDAAARAVRLMPDGAIETINEWAFDKFDEPIFEDDETLIIPAHILKLLEQMDAS